MKKAMKRASKQKGFTLLEMLIGGAILVVVIALLYPILAEQLAKRRGVAEGEYITRAAICQAEKARAMGGTGSVTFVLSLNNGCFGDNERIVGRGTTAATLNNSLTSSAYTVGQCNVYGTNDGVYVDSVSGPQSECLGVIQGAQDQGAHTITVTPSGGSAVTIKNVGGRADLGNAALSTACGAQAPVTVRACVRSL